MLRASEPASLNGIRNNTAVGIAAGSPGTLPTNWSTGGGTGLTRTVVGGGDDNGIEYADIRWAGTPSATLFINIETNTQIAAVLGQTWTHSAFFKLAAGALTGVSACSINIGEANSGGTALIGSGTNFTPTTAALIGQRAQHTRTLNQATVAFAQAYMTVSFTGAAVDFTLRIGLPQIELGQYPTSPIRTSGSPVLRGFRKGSF